MKAIAFNNYLSDKKGFLCCDCIENDQQDYPYLFFSITKPVKVNSDIKCALCGLAVGRRAAGQAAERIADMLSVTNSQCD